MRGSDERTGELFSYVDLEKRVPAKHPLRLVRGGRERGPVAARWRFCQGLCDWRSAFNCA